MTASGTTAGLDAENVRHRGTGGVSAANRDLGFEPAFIDRATRAVYRSRFADGRPAPFHVLDGLPDEVVLSRAADGRVARVKPSVEAGFLRRGHFYDRAAAARIVQRA